MSAKDILFNQEYWDIFYKNNHRHTPSQFCVMVMTEVGNDKVIVEFGSGNGRDSHYFAAQGYVCVGMDLSKQAIESSQAHAKDNNISHSFFIQGDLSKDEDVSAVIKRARKEAGEKELVIYSRFVMHSLDDDQEEAFLTSISKNLKTGEKVYFEFRSKEDAMLEKHFGGHFRRYLDTDKFKSILVDTKDFSIEYSYTGCGMAKYKKEDPFVSRVIAQKN